MRTLCSSLSQDIWWQEETLTFGLRCSIQPMNTDDSLLIRYLTHSIDYNIQPACVSAIVYTATLGVVPS